jgi:hypothetical protein
MPSWSATLPQLVDEDGYNERPPRGSIRTPMGAGPAKARRVSSSNSRMIDVSLKMTFAQVETFDAFFLDTIKGGALSFTWVNPRTQVSKDCRIVADSENGPSYSQPDSDESIIVSFTLEILP